jgi:hypothetical protein
MTTVDKPMTRLTDAARSLLRQIADAGEIKQTDAGYRAPDGQILDLPDGWLMPEPQWPEPDDGAVVRATYEGSGWNIYLRRDDWSGSDQHWYPVGSPRGHSWESAIRGATAVEVLAPVQSAEPVTLPLRISDRRGQRLVIQSTPESQARVEGCVATVQLGPVALDLTAADALAASRALAQLAAGGAK